MSNPISRFFSWSEQPEAKALIAWNDSSEARNYAECSLEELKAFTKESEQLRAGSEVAWQRTCRRLYVLQALCLCVLVALVARGYVNYYQQHGAENITRGCR